MRVTQQMLSNNFLRYYRQSTEKIDKAQEQLTTGKKFNKPSDNPYGITNAMRQLSEIKSIEQYDRNTTTAVSWMESSDAALQDASDILKRASELVVQGANETNTPQSRNAIADEIAQLKEQLGSVANTTLGGKYIFSGAKNDSPLYQNGNLAHTNNDDVRWELSENITLPMNVKGISLFGAESKAGKGDNVFKLMEEIENTLRSPNGKVGPLLEDINNQLDNVINIHGELGARMNRIELIQNRLGEQSIIATKVLSKEQDADMAEVITKLQAQENVHKASLSAGARIIQPTLLDFIR